MDFFTTFLYYLSSVITLTISSTTVQKNNFPKKRKICIFLFSFFMLFVLAPFLQQRVTIFVLFGTCILLTYKLPHKMQNLISFFFGYILLVCLDYLFSFVCYLGFDITVPEIQQNYFIFFFITYIPIFFLLAKVLQWILHKKLRIHSIFSSGPFAWGIVGNLAVNVFIFAFLITFGEKVGYSPQIIFFNGILFLTCFILSNLLFIIVYRTKAKENALEFQLMQYENLSSYTHEVEHLYQNMKTFKHDYIDILSSMKFYIDENNMEQLSDYFYKKIIPYGEKISTHNSQLGKLSYIEQDILKSFIFSKLVVASEKNLHVDIELQKPVPPFPIQELDLIRVLGIFLNNAIEAASDSEEKKLVFAIVCESKNTTILIRNSSKPLSIPLHKLCDNGSSSKTSHTGIGLHTAKQILDSYQNIIWKFQYDAPYFTVELSLNHERN